MTNFKEDLMQVKAFAFDVDGVLSSDIISMHPTGEPMRTSNIKDGFALQKAAKLGYPIAIITGGNSEAVRKRYSDLGVKDIYMAASHKVDEFNDWIEKRGLKPENVMYMGDDLPDYHVMKMVGVPVCPADAVEEIKSLCKYISDRKGGRGCARDVIEQVLRAHGRWGSVYEW
ncbi:MAG: HAD hydrolase family protein [Bacteroidales bacterium]|nr:HAD hydrolase family protein [Bacteroidales bacterium]HBG88539.1 3-deoxy-D-manno-octulosonate 8-phosphate phosphatase [Marinilabiliaceae bacterium]HBX89067.1 3-deoxy-D-manno-octulosonate 8-phosphate phosphatase [Marinilabiliaceae bacterium]